MKTLTNLLLLLLLLSLPCAAQTQKDFVKEFNSIASKNINGGNEGAYILLKCGTVSENMTFVSGDSGASLILEVDSDASGHNVYNSAIYGEDTADDFETVIGWEYYFNAPRGQIVVSLKNKGQAYTEVFVLHGDGYRKSKSKCTIENLIKS